MMKWQWKEFLKRQDGLTLIDIAVAMIVLGLIAAPMLVEYNRLAQIEKQTETKNKMSAIDAAITNYFIENLRYPCPADPATNIENDVAYGRELFDTVANTCLPSGGMVANSTANGFVGSVPFQTLKITEEQVIDGYGNKITYSISGNMLDDTAVTNTLQGTFTVNNLVIGPGPAFVETFIPRTELSRFVLISHGDRGVGAYPKFANDTGDRIPCAAFNAGAIVVTPARELENCDNDDEFNSAFNLSIRSIAYNDNYYDDHTKEGGIRPDGMWNNSTEAGGADPEDAYSPYTGVGIGTNDPDEQLHVVGNMRVNAEVKTTEYCDPATGTLCFTPDLLGSTGIQCGGNQAMRGIEFNTGDCAVTITGPLVGSTCPAGQVITGFNPAGVPICS